MAAPFETREPSQTSSTPVSDPEPRGSQALLGAHDMEDEHARALDSVKNATRGLDDLPIPTAAEFLGKRAEVRVGRQSFDVREHLLDQALGSVSVVESDVVRDGVEVVQRSQRPDYFSHRAMCVLAAE